MVWNLSPQEFANKFEVVPAIINDWAQETGGLHGREILDFGCGEGLQAAGIAHAYKPAALFGVDVNDEHQELGEILKRNGRQIISPPTFKRIAPGAALPFRSLDFIYSWSVFEHIDLSIYDEVIADLRSALKEQGNLFVQISPLYFSPEGSHLWAAGYTSWEHLTKQLSVIQRDLNSGALSPEAAKQTWGMFIALNRITTVELVARLERGGFKLVRKYESQTDKMPPPHLIDAYSEHALKTEQIVALFEKI